MSVARNRSRRPARGRLCLWLLLAGCAGPRHAAPAPEAARLHAGDDWRTASDPLSKSMRVIATQLELLGLRPGADAFSGFLIAGARGTHPIDLPARTCVTLLAIASRGIQDMDAAIYSPDGDVLAVDSQPDAQPTLQACSGDEPSRLYYTLQVYEGAGSFLMAGFLGEHHTLEVAAKVLGVRPVVADLGDVGADGAGRVAAFRDGLQRRGFQPVQSPVRVPLVHDQRIRAVLAVEPGACYTAAGFALDGLSNVDLRVLDDEGIEVARDASEAEDASAQFCAERGAEYAAELHGVSGKGSALLLLFRVAAATIGGRAGLWLGERPMAKASSVALPDAIAAVTRRAVQDGFKQARTLRTGQLAPGAAVAQHVGLRPRHCARIHVVGGPGLRRLSLDALEASGRRVAQAEGDAQTAYVHVCSASARELTLEAHAAEGSGPFAITVYEAPIAAVTPKGVDEIVGAELQQGMRQARDAGYRLYPEFQEPQRIHIQQSQPVSIKLEPEPLRCVRAYVLSHGPSARGELVVAGNDVDAADTSGEPARFCTGKESAAELKSVELRLSTDAAQDDAWVMILLR